MKAESEAAKLYIDDAGIDDHKCELAELEIASRHSNTSTEVDMDN